MHYLLATVIAGAGFFLYAEPAKWLVQSWQTNSYYQHGFLLLGVSIFIAVWKLTKTCGPVGKNSWAYLLTASILLSIAGDWLGSNTFKALPIFLILLSLAYLPGFRLPSHELRFPILLPALAIPLPFLPEITAFLQFSMVQISTTILQFLGFKIHAEGALIHLSKGDVILGGPCSGIQSLISLVTLMVLAVYFTKITLKKKVLLCFFAIPIALMGNLIRILLFLIAGSYYNVEIVSARWHDVGNICFFVFSLLLMSGVWYLVVQRGTYLSCRDSKNPISR